MTKFTAACVLGAALFAFPAAAQEEAFNGPSVTLITGVDDNVVTGYGQKGVLYGGQVGYDVQRGNFVFGIEGEIAGASSSGCRTYVDTAPVSNNTTCVDARRDLYAGGRVGVVLGDNTLLYGKVGYTNARNRIGTSFSATPAANFVGSGNSEGVRVGAGVEEAIGKSLSLKAEYRFSNYDGGYKRHQGVVGIGYRF